MASRSKRGEKPEVEFMRWRYLLISIAYRITGSRVDAEDVVQEAGVRWIGADRGAVRTPRAFLTTTVSRLSLNHLRARKARQEDYPGDWLPEPLADDGAEEDARLDALSFGVMALLERLTPLQRAVFVLRTALDEDYATIAATVGRGEAACRQAFSRARRALKAGKVLNTVPEREQRVVLGRFLAAVADGDREAVAALLTEDVIMRGDGGRFGPALRRPLRGREAVARFVVASRKLLPAATEVAIELLNGTPSAVVRKHGRVVLAILVECAPRGGIARVFAIANPEKLNASGRA